MKRSQLCQKVLFCITAGLLMLFLVPPVFGLTTGPCTPSERQIGIGEETFFSIRVKGMESEAELRVGGVSDGLECNFDDNPLPANQGNGNGETKLRCSASSNTTFDIQELEITATEGAISDTCRVKLTAVDRPAELKVNASPSSREISCEPGDEAVYNVNVQEMAGPVKLAVLPSLPVGISIEFEDNPLSPSGNGTTADTKLRVTTNGKTEKGPHTLTIRADDGVNTADVRVTLESDDCAEGDFSLSADPDKIEAEIGNEYESEISVDFTGGCEGPVKLTLKTGSLPPGLTASLVGNTVSKTNPDQIVKFAVGENVPAGNYKVMVTGDGCDTEDAVTISLTIGEEEGGFTLSADPEKIKAEIGGEKESEISVDFTGSCKGPVEISLDKTSLRRLPNGLSVALNGRILDVNDPDEALTVTVGTTVPAGEYLVEIVGEGCDTEDSAVVTILVEAPKLAIVKRQRYSSVVPGQVQVYTIDVTNEGDVPVTRVMVTDELESNLEFVKHTAKGQHTAIERNHSFSLAEKLDSGKTVSFKIHARVDDTLKKGITISNTAEVTATESPEPEASNTVTAITSYTPVKADALYVDKSLAAGRPKISGILVYRIRVENRHQTGRVFDIKIDDRLPNGFRYVEGSSLLNGKKIADPAGNGRRIVWKNLGGLSAGDSFTLKYRVVIGANAKSGRNENCADVTGADGGGNEVSGSDCALVNIGPGDVKELGEIKARVFLDENGNGIKDAADIPFEDAEIILVPPGLKQVTDVNGETLFSELDPKAYVVAFNPLVLTETYRFNGDHSLLVQLLEGEKALEEILIAVPKGEIIVTVDIKRKRNINSKNHPRDDHR